MQELDIYIVHCAHAPCPGPIAQQKDCFADINPDNCAVSIIYLYLTAGVLISSCCLCCLNESIHHKLRWAEVWHSLQFMRNIALTQSPPQHWHKALSQTGIQKFSHRR